MTGISLTMGVGAALMIGFAVVGIILFDKKRRRI